MSNRIFFQLVVKPKPEFFESWKLLTLVSMPKWLYGLENDTNRWEYVGLDDSEGTLNYFGCNKYPDVSEIVPLLDTVEHMAYFSIDEEDRVELLWSKESPLKLENDLCHLTDKGLVLDDPTSPIALYELIDDLPTEHHIYNHSGKEYFTNVSLFELTLPDIL